MSFMSFITNLQKRINRVTEGYFANWTPDLPISVGDYGDITALRFTRDGNISRYGLDLEIEGKRVKSAKFEREDGVKITKSLAAEGEVNDALVGCDINVKLKFGKRALFYTT